MPIDCFRRGPMVESFSFGGLRALDAKKKHRLTCLGLLFDCSHAVALGAVVLCTANLLRPDGET